MVRDKDVARKALLLPALIAVVLFLLLTPRIVKAGALVRAGIEGGFLAVREMQKGTRGPIVFELQPGDWVPASKGWSVLKAYSMSGEEKHFHFASQDRFLDEDKVSWSIDLRPGAHTSLFAQPQCLAATQKCQAIAWPDREAQIQVQDAALAWRRSKMTGTEGWGLIYQVRFAYPQHRKCKSLNNDPECLGWLDSKNVTFAPLAESTPVAQSEAAAPAATATPAEKPEVGPTAPKVQEAFAPPPQHNNSTLGFEALKATIGQCVVNPKKKHVKFKPKTRGETAFDAYLAPYWKKQKYIPEVINERGKKATPAEVAAIDAMARTLYAEMAECYDNDPRYLAAVGRVILNRAESAETRNVEGIFMQPEEYELHFENDPQKNLKHPITRVVTKPWQFSAWNPKTYLRRGPASRPREIPNPSLEHLLCPPAPANKVFWKGEPPSQLEREIWDYVSYLSIKAVLFPTSYKKEDAAGLDAHYYTSGVNMKRPYKRVYPRMGDFGFPNGRCMKFWTARGL